MDTTKTIRVSIASKQTGVHRTTILAAIGRGEIPIYPTGCGLPLVRLADVQRWDKKARQFGPRRRF